ncbi:glycosyltransferase [Pseudovirgaria hyperparasitica]|uniref:Glycosyltransferase n=1 Tax=Pseudovirgaria hyperparasitica TaxID=470096 RepID=A0A6A6VU34_9PEZI|nr:glycosyltransferase [Pseudovirgaria hyperparasitica]KAF2753409.1 glycosyltransferase [Pseudovirgaria hyperparasitica]
MDQNFPQDLKGRKILLATESLGPINGVSRTTGSLIQYLRDNGAQVAVVAPKFAGPTTVTNARNDPEVRLDGYPLPYNPDLTVAYPLRLDTIYSKSFHPDLIYLASPASVGFQLLLQIRQMGSPPPVMLNFQTDLSAYSEIIFPKPMDQYAVWLLALVQGFLFSHSAVHTIFYPSGMVREYLEKAGAPMSKTFHLGRGVDTALFRPEARDMNFRKTIAPHGEIILLCVGRIAPEKGFGFLAEVVQRLDAAGSHFKMVITGGNQNPAVEEDVQKLFKSVEHRVVFTGFRKGAALACVYASADLFLHCSITETFGLVVLEAMASGLPVVARDQGGPSEIVVDEKSGHLIRPDDVRNFVAKTQRLIQSSELRRQMSQTARSIALNTTWQKINNKVALKISEALAAAEAAKKNRPIRNWIAARLRSIIIAIRINMAIGLTYFMWGIAVLPLLIHGSSRFPDRFVAAMLPNLQPIGNSLSHTLRTVGL